MKQKQLLVQTMPQVRQFDECAANYIAARAHDRHSHDESLTTPSVSCVPRNSGHGRPGLRQLDDRKTRQKRNPTERGLAEGPVMLCRSADQTPTKYGPWTCSAQARICGPARAYRHSSLQAVGPRSTGRQPRVKFGVLRPGPRTTIFGGARTTYRNFHRRQTQRDDD